jgi:hypothetical protein
MDTDTQQNAQLYQQMDYEDEDYSEYQTADANPLHAESTCWGCQQGVLNQLGHMDYGGCLYFEEDADSQNEIIETQSFARTVDDDDENKETTDE